MKRSRVWLWWLVPIALVLGVARLRFDVEILNLLPQKLSVAQGLKTYQDNFSDAHELILTVAAPTEDGTTTAARALARRLRAETNLVAAATWQPAWTEDPAQAAEWIAFLWLNQPPAEFAVLTNRLGAARRTDTLRETRAQLATSFSPGEIAQLGYDPYGLTRLPESVASAAPSVGAGEELFTSPDGTYRLVFVEAKPDIVSYRACRAWLSEVERIVAEAKRSGLVAANVAIQFTGRPAFVTEIAGGMERDMTGSASGTLLVIGVLFWLTHRRLRPLIWLLILLLAILAGTTALGGLFLGTINVVSMGFAAILCGLAEDFGIVLYQESRSHPELDARGLRRIAAPGIIWSAVTTAGAFLLLNLSSLPGLGQLGSLVAIGVLLAAAVMLFGFLPPLLRWRRAQDLVAAGRAGQERFLLFNFHRVLPASAVWIATAALLVVAAIVLWREPPRFDHTPNVLKPKKSAANAALEQIKARFGRPQELLWVLVPGRDESEVARRLDAANRWLSQATSDGMIAGFTLPTALWPRPVHQQANRRTLATVLGEREALMAAAQKEGFTTNALALTSEILDHWERAVAGTNVFWPTNRASQWMLEKVVARPTSGFLALGLVHPTTNGAAMRELLAGWPAELRQQGVILTGWPLLGSTVFETVIHELPVVLLPILVLVAVSLGVAFRRVKGVILSLAALAFGGLLLAAAMSLLGWEWNLLNLMALPLLLGMGVDFSIHLQLALRRCGGDVLAVRRSIGRALLLAAATTVAGFASLAFSTNAGMASLGKVCALGIVMAALTAIHLLPVWWKAWCDSPNRTKL